MRHDDVCFLVSEDPAAHGVLAPRTETARMVYCAVKSVSRREYYEALDHKVAPTVIFVLQDAIEYQGEKIVLWTPRGGAQQRYGVIRTYTQPDGSIEIVCEDAAADRTAPAPAPVPAQEVTGHA